MDYRQRIQEGAKHATWTAQKSALTNCVFVCTNKEKKLFEFIPLEEVILFPNSANEIKLSEYFISVQNSIKELKNKLADKEVEINNLKTSLIELANYIDNQRFL